MTQKLPIFMDYQSTTPLDPRALEDMLPYLTNDFGNAASRNHSFGWKAEEATEHARDQVAKLIGAIGKEIVWTSGATESNNLALKGAAEYYRERGNHIITSQIEHKAILDTCKRLEKMGFNVTYLPVNSQGFVEPHILKESLRDDTILVSIMHANNEVGTINHLKELVQSVKQYNHSILFHTDAAQSAGKIPIDVNELQLDMVSLSAHKMYGPKGIGALYVRRKPRVRIVQQIDGGGHERGMRSGTLNVPAIVGFGKAAELALFEMSTEVPRINKLRDLLYKKITEKLPDVHLNGPEFSQRLPGNLNLSFAYVEGEGLMMALKDVAVSSGSACTSASLEPSYVLKALGIHEELAHTSIRFGIGRFTTEEEVSYVTNLVVDKVNRLRELSPLWEMKQEGIDLNSIDWSAEH